MPMGRVYTRALRLERHARRLAHNGRQPDFAALPPLVTSPAIIVAWDYVPRAAARPASVCEFAEDAPSRVLINLPGDVPGRSRAGAPAARP